MANYTNPYLPYPPQFYNNPNPFPIPPAPQAPQDTLEVRFIQGGSNSAKAYPVMPGKTVLLMDSEESKFYLKKMDAYGVPSPLREFNYTEVFETPANDIPVATEVKPEYVTKDDFNAFADKMIGMLSEQRKPRFEKKGGQRNAESDL